MKIIDESHPFYKPLWRRVALVGVLAGWTAFEVFYTQQPLWMLVAGGAFCLCGLDIADFLAGQLSELSLRP